MKLCTQHLLSKFAEVQASFWYAARSTRPTTSKTTFHDTATSFFGRLAGGSSSSETRDQWGGAGTEDEQTGNTKKPYDENERNRYTKMEMGVTIWFACILGQSLKLGTKFLSRGSERN